MWYKITRKYLLMWKFAQKLNICFPVFWKKRARKQESSRFELRNTCVVYSFNCTIYWRFSIRFDDSLPFNFWIRKLSPRIEYISDLNFSTIIVTAGHAIIRLLLLSNYRNCVRLDNATLFLSSTCNLKIFILVLLCWCHFYSKRLFEWISRK